MTANPLDENRVVSIWMGRSDPFAYWYSEKPIAALERKCTKEEAEELAELTVAVERMQQLLRDIDRRNAKQIRILATKTSGG